MYQNTRLSKQWLLMDFMHDPAVYEAYKPLPFANVVTEEVVDQGTQLCMELIEPMMAEWGVASVSAGYRPHRFGASGPHRWNDEVGAAADFIFHDWVNRERSPIELGSGPINRD